MLNLLLAYVYNPIAGCLTTKYLVMRPEKNNALISVLDSEQIEAPGQQHVAPGMLEPITRDLDNDGAASHTPAH
jgi:hypothetical protein